jgi:hypothetical protein
MSGALSGFVLTALFFFYQKGYDEVKDTGRDVAGQGGGRRGYRYLFEAGNSLIGIAKEHGAS